MKRCICFLLFLVWPGLVSAQSNEEKFYYGQYNSCMRGLNNVRSVRQLGISEKTQEELCKCTAEQMVERVNLNTVENLVKADKSNLLIAFIEITFDASVTFCEQKLNISILPEQKD